MTVSKALMIALMTSALTIVGCGDDGGGGDASGSCFSQCEVQEAAAIQACLGFYDLCIQGASRDDCLEAALRDCAL